MAPRSGTKSKGKTAASSSSSSSTSKAKKNKPPPIDKLVGPAIGVGLAILGYYFLRGLKGEIPRIDVNDELVLREVFFGEGEGKNYVVLCSKEEEKISSVFNDARNEGSNLPNTEFVTTDCEFILPSEKSIAERFSLDLKSKPTIFVSGKVGSPKQITAGHLKSGKLLLKLLRSMLEPHAAKIENTKDLKTKCLNKDVCALLLKGTKPEKYIKDAVTNLMEKYPDVQMASVDSSNLLLTNLEEFLPEFEKGKHRFVLFKKVSGGLEVADNESEKKAGSSRLITSIVPLGEAEGDTGALDVTFGSMDSIIGGTLDGTTSVRKLTTLPVVKIRTKKAEEAERAKRQRAHDRANRKTQEADGTTSSATGEANDGSKEGRRLERERRREEHRKAQGNYRERTPEEIAEMERKRRQRMEEEAAKWNIAPEDAPEEGDPIEEEYDLDDLDQDGSYFVDEDDDDQQTGQDQEGGSGENEDEEVMDLD